MTLLLALFVARRLALLALTAAPIVAYCHFTGQTPAEVVAHARDAFDQARDAIQAAR